MYIHTNDKWWLGTEVSPLQGAFAALPHANSFLGEEKKEKKRKKNQHILFASPFAVGSLWGEFLNYIM